MSHTDVLTVPLAQSRPWGRAFAWLLFLAPVFYITYGTANFLAAHRQRVPAVVFEWEHQVPFLAWTIVPYWTINAFYAASLFVCATREELERHGRRLLTAQLLAVALWLVAGNYVIIGPEGFQKDAAGNMSLAARLLLAPYLLAAFVISRLWTRGEPAAVAVADAVWLGRIPTRHSTAAFTSVLDVCAELPRTGSTLPWTAVPMLDLVPPGATALRAAAAHIERQRRRGPVLVCCALGYSRSAAAIAVWLMTSGRAANAETAIAAIRRVRPRIVIGSDLRAAIVAAAEPQA